MDLDLSIIIVNYNTHDLLRNCLQSIYDQTDDIEFEVIIVDNASPKGDVGKIELANIADKKPQIKLIRQAANIGFGPANNVALARAEGCYVLFLNPDTIILDKAISKMYRRFSFDSQVVLLGPKLLNEDLSLQPSFGNFPTLSNIMADRLPLLRKMPWTYFIRTDAYYADEKQPDWLMGACIMGQRSLFDELGGFDEKIFMYGEDVDLCYRFKKQYPLNSLLYYPQAEVIHLDNGSKNFKWDKAILNRLGILYFFFKHGQWLSFIWFRRLIRYESSLKYLWQILKQPVNYNKVATYDKLRRL